MERLPPLCCRGLRSTATLACSNKRLHMCNALFARVGVRELFEKTVAEPKKRTRGELHKIIDADYFGYKVY